MVTSMLEKAIEIEGLLRIIRDGNPQPETYALLHRKTQELVNGTQKMEYQIPNHEPSTPINEELPMKDGKQALKKETIASETNLIVIDKTGIEIMDPTDPTKVIKPILIDMTEKLKEEGIEKKEEHEDLSEAEEEIDSAPNADGTPEENTTEEISSEPELQDSEATSDEEIDEEDDILLSFDDDEEATLDNPEEDDDGETIIHIIDAEDTSADTSEEEQEIEIHIETPDIEIKKNEDNIKERPSLKKQSTLKSAFSLNDRFLYSRELFNGNMKMFDSTLEHIEGIGDYSVAEDYFYNELEWDRERPEVASFMEIIKLKM